MCQSICVMKWSWAGEGNVWEMADEPFGSIPARIIDNTSHLFSLRSLLGKINLIQMALMMLVGQDSQRITCTLTYIGIVTGFNPSRLKLIRLLVVLTFWVCFYRTPKRWRVVMYYICRASRRWRGEDVGRAPTMGTTQGRGALLSASQSSS